MVTITQSGLRTLWDMFEGRGPAWMPEPLLFWCYPRPRPIPSHVLNGSSFQWCVVTRWCALYVPINIQILVPQEFARLLMKTEKHVAFLVCSTPGPLCKAPIQLHIWFEILNACRFRLGLSISMTFFRLIKMSSPNINNLTLLGCVIMYLTMFFRETDPDKDAKAIYCKVT